MGYQGTSGGAFYPGTVASFGLNNVRGRTYTNNVQLNPLLTGGLLPSGLDTNYHPNTTYFLPTQAASPLILATHNSLLGDSNHGYSSSPDKFAVDILGVKRTSWSIGAYEAAAVPPPPTGLHVVTGP